MLSRATTRLSQLSLHLGPTAIRPLATTTTTTRSMTTFKLNTGASIPAIGFGTWQDKDAQEGAVLSALKAGYRHIDGAFV